MIYKAGVGALAAAAGLGLVVGVEILLAMRRDYLPTEPRLEVSGIFGPKEGPGLSFAVLGDSTAAGVGAESAAGAYPALLAGRLASRGRRVRLSALGVSGARAEDVLEKQVPTAVQAAPELVFVAVGANDTLHVTPLGEVASNLGSALDLLLASGATVVVGGVPDMRAGAFHEPLRSLVGWRGRRVTEAISRAAGARNVPVVPLAEKTGSFFGADPGAHYSRDLLHPGPAGYERWADAIYPFLERALAEREAGRASLAAVGFGDR